MSRLAQLQRDFYAYLRGGPIAPVASDVVDRGPAPIPVRLGIYAHAYNKRLAEALEADHEMLGRYLGDALWERMCREYIAAHPSQLRSLRGYGNSLPNFLATHEPFAQHPLLAELATFERGLLDVFDAADAPHLPWSQVLALPPESWPGMRLRAHPSVRLLAGNWNAVPTWQALKAGREPPSAQRMSMAWLLWRDAERITQFRAPVTHEMAALTAIIAGEVEFAGLCERLAEHLPTDEVPNAALGLLQIWFASGLVGAIA